MCRCLPNIYKRIYDEEFEYSDFDKRIKLQKAVYLLENMGLHIGNYSFVLDQRGPYSIALDFDAKKYGNNGIADFKFSEKAENKIKKLKNILLKKKTYSDLYWMECIATVYYFKFVLNVSNSKQLLERLVAKKEYLDNHEENQNALNVADAIRKEI